MDVGLSEYVANALLLCRDCFLSFIWSILSLPWGVKVDILILIGKILGLIQVLEYGRYEQAVRKEVNQ